MRSSRLVTLLGLLLAGCASVPHEPPPGRRPPRLFISPAGEPFRPDRAGGPAATRPVDRWRAQVDTDGDGVITRAELAKDFDRFFTLLDVDKDGQLVGPEVTRYEREIAPEILMGGGGPPPGAGPGAGPDGGRQHADQSRTGAGMFGLLNDPQPVMSADYDLSRRVTRAEFTRKAGLVFTRLDRNADDKLTADELEPPEFKPGRGGASQGGRRGSGGGGSRGGGHGGRGGGGGMGGGMGGGGMGGPGF